MEEVISYSFYICDEWDAPPWQPEHMNIILITRETVRSMNIVTFFIIFAWFVRTRDNPLCFLLEQSSSRRNRTSRCYFITFRYSLRRKFIVQPLILLQKYVDWQTYIHLSFARLKFIILKCDIINSIRCNLFFLWGRIRMKNRFERIESPWNYWKYEQNFDSIWIFIGRLNLYSYYYNTR